MTLSARSLEKSPWLTNCISHRPATVVRLDFISGILHGFCELFKTFSKSFYMVFFWAPTDDWFWKFKFYWKSIKKFASIFLVFYICSHIHLCFYAVKWSGRFWVIRSKASDFVPLVIYTYYVAGCKLWWHISSSSCHILLFWRKMRHLPFNFP